MFDIDKALDEIRDINVSPSVSLVEKVMHIAKQKPEENETVNISEQVQKKDRRANIIKFSSFAMPVAATILVAFFAFNIFSSSVCAYYTVDINPSVKISVDRSGIVSDMEFVGEEEIDMLDSQKVVGEEPLDAINQIIRFADKQGYIGEQEDVLVGSFVMKDVHKRTTEKEISAYLSDDINLLYIQGEKQQIKQADKQQVSAGLISLGDLIEGYDVKKGQSLDEVIDDIESITGKSVEEVLEQNKKDIVYTAPKLNVNISGDTAFFTWDYIDYAKNNYEGEVVYNFVCANTQQEMMTNPTVIDEYSFTAYKAQPVDYTYILSEQVRGKYYAVIVIYEDGKRIVDDNFVFIP